MPVQPGRCASRLAAGEALEPRVLLATFTVTNADDEGTGSLRQAILNANAGSDLDEGTILGTGLSRQTLAGKRVFRYSRFALKLGTGPSFPPLSIWIHPR